MKTQVLLLVSSTLFPWFVAPETNCDSAKEASCQSSTGTAMLQKKANMERVLIETPDESAEGGSTMAIYVPVSSVGFKGVEGDTSSLSNKVVPRSASNYARYTFRIDPSGKAPLLVTPGKMIFGEEMLNKTSSIADRKTKTSTMMSESLETADKNFAASLSLKGGYSAFSASASASTKMMSKSNIRKIRCDRIIQSTVYKISNNAVSPHTFLEEDWKDFLLKETPEDIVDRIGEFYATEVVMGGVFRASFLKEVEKTESSASFKAEIEASGLPLTGSGDAKSSGSTNNTKNSERMTKITESQGGDPTVWLGLTKTNQDEIQKKWAQTVNDATLAVTELKLRPIWELLDEDDMDKTKAQLLKGWMIKKWNEEAKNAIDFSTFPYADAGYTLDRTNEIFSDSKWLWNKDKIDAHKDKASTEIIDACYHSVLLDNECSKDYFLYIAKGEYKGCCSCKTTTKDEFSSPSHDWVADTEMYKILLSPNLIEIKRGSGNAGNGECTFGLEWDDKGPEWRVSFYALTKDHPNTKKISFANNNEGWPRVIEGGLKDLNNDDYPHHRNEVYVYDNWVPGTKEFTAGRYDAYWTDVSCVSEGNKENHAKSYGNANLDAFSFFAYSDKSEAVAP